MSNKRFISGGRAIAAVLDRSLKATYHLLESKQIPGSTKLGGIWTLDVERFAAEAFARDEAAA